jgi:hypothetical protein
LAHETHALICLRLGSTGLVQIGVNVLGQVATDEEGMRKLIRMMLIPAVLKDSAD